MHPTVPKRVLGLEQFDAFEVEAENEARVRHGDGDVPDFCIVGSGPGGAVTAAKLAEAGLRVVVLEAGPFWVPDRDWASDELAQNKLYWTDPRVTGGDDPLVLGSNNSGKGVGGSTVHHTMVKLRFHRSDFRTYSADGVGDDWPIGYDDLAPYYDEVEADLGIAGPTRFPWGEFHGPFPQRAHPISQHAKALQDACAKVGITTVVAPTATLSSPKDGRPPCTYRGFCVVGCKPNAKSSELVTYVPRAVRAGAVVKHGSMAVRLDMDDGRVRSVTYRHAGRTYEQRARTFVLAGSAIETPRLLLSSADARAPNGVANASGLVGRRLMTHTSHRVYARFPGYARQYKAPPALLVSQDLYATDPDRGFARGYTLESVGALPVGFARFAASSGRWGRALRETMLDYNHYAGMGFNGEVLPYGRNEVRLASETDHHGMRVAHVRFSYGENERRLIEHGYATLDRVMQAGGASDVFHADDTAHLMGTCRMGDDPRTSVVDPWCRAHDVPNLFVVDASVFVTGAGVNPSLTVEAIAARTGDHLARVRE